MAQQFRLVNYYNLPRNILFCNMWYVYDCIYIYVYVYMCVIWMELKFFYS